MHYNYTMMMTKFVECQAICWLFKMNQITQQSVAQTQKTSTKTVFAGMNDNGMNEKHQLW